MLLGIQEKTGWRRCKIAVAIALPLVGLLCVVIVMTACSRPPESVLMEASRPPTYPFSPPTLDERIFLSDTIAIVRPISVEPSVLTLRFTTEQPQYSPVVQSRFEVIEYLKGEGDSEIIVETKEDFYVATPNVEQALQTAESKAASQLAELGGGDAVVFFTRTEHNPDFVLDTSLKASETEWRKHNAQTGLFSTGQGVGSASTTFRTASVSAQDDEQSEEFSVDELRERIEAMESLLREGEGIEGWEYCITSRFIQENYLRAWEFPSVFDIEPYPSGLPADSIVEEFSTYSRRWFTGDNASLFYYGANDVRTTRPIPAGAYEVNSYSQESEWVPCDYVPPPLILRYNFESAEGTLREAFFDPVDIGEAVGADGESGVLQPEWFETDDGETVIERIAWSEGQVEMELSPATDFDDHRMDFIALDGSVALRLDFDDAAALSDEGDVATFAWGVCEQPWEDGDLLMLRIAEGIPDDDIAATNDPECLAGQGE